MQLLKLSLASALLLLALTANAQVSDLPVSADGVTPRLPQVYVSIGLGAYIGAWTHSGGLSGYAWGEAGEDIEDMLNALDIDLSDYAGVLEYDVIFKVGNVLMPRHGQVQKNLDEDLEEMFEREYGLGKVEGLNERRLQSKRFQELWLMEQAQSWFNYAGYSVGAHYFGGYNNGGISHGRGVVTVTDCDDVCGEDP